MTLGKESHFQLEDLNAIREDLGMLKFGSGLLQDANYNITTEIFRLKNANEKLIERIDEQDSVLSLISMDLRNVGHDVSDLYDAFIRHRRMSNRQFRELFNQIVQVRVDCTQT